MARTLFNPIRPNPLLGFWARLAQRAAVPVHIITQGDSIFEGHGATTLSDCAASRMITQLRQRLGVSGGGAGFIPARYGALNRQSADGWTTTGRTSDNSYGFGKRSRTLLLDGGTGQGDGTM